MFGLKFRKKETLECNAYQALEARFDRLEREMKRENDDLHASIDSAREPIQELCILMKESHTDVNELKASLRALERQLEDISVELKRLRAPFGGIHYFDINESVEPPSNRRYG